MVLAQGNAQATNMHVDRPQFDFLTVRPDGFEQLLAGEDALRVLEQMAQQPVFGRPKRHGLCIATDAVRDGVHFDAVIAKFFGEQAGVNGAAAQARRQLLGLKLG